jgi:hypothetical protein
MDAWGGGVCGRIERGEDAERRPVREGIEERASASGGRQERGSRKAPTRKGNGIDEIRRDGLGVSTRACVFSGGFRGRRIGLWTAEIGFNQVIRERLVPVT